MIKIKVCGMREPDNIRNLIQLSPDFIGFIFYPESKRYVGEDFPVTAINSVPSGIKKVGVFVNELLEHVVKKYNKYNLDYVQLHGKEQVEYCRELMTINIKVIKAFGIDGSFDMTQTEKYSDSCNYFLFDTKSAQYGGTGRKFNWNHLTRIPDNKPFFLSGGIGPEDIDEIKKLNIPELFAIDINSRFEQSPGLKDITMLQKFITEFK